jgi:RNA polymerase sigma-70 factor (ECF subfamily)
MLQCVLGLDAARIAGAFLVSEAAMAKRLVRAKARIRDAGIAFERPDADDLATRVGDVLSAVYAAYSAGWEMADGASPVAPDLAEEALWLARLVAALMPGEPEALGLLSLLLYCEARRPARRDHAGRFVPLAEQDTRLWVRERVVEAEGLLAAAARCRRFGRFQCEAAIQSVHCHRATTGDTDWPAILRLYDLLLAREPSLGAMVAGAAALSSSGDADGALAALRAVGPANVERYQPYWATLADALGRRGEHRAAEEARARAARLARDDAVRAFLSAPCDT